MDVEFAVFVHYVLYGSEHGPDDDIDVTYSTPSDEWIGVDGEPTPDIPENGSDTGDQSSALEREVPEAMRDSRSIATDDEIAC